MCRFLTVHAVASWCRSFHQRREISIHMHIACIYFSCDESFGKTFRYAGVRFFQSVFLDKKRAGPVRRLFYICTIISLGGCSVRTRSHTLRPDIILSLLFLCVAHGDEMHFCFFAERLEWRHFFVSDSVIAVFWPEHAFQADFRTCYMHTLWNTQSEIRSGISFRASDLKNITGVGSNSSAVIHFIDL